MRHQLLASFVAIGVSIGGLTGCVQMPTESQGAVDMRPSLGFDVKEPALVEQGRLYVDGLPMGMLGDYSNGRGMLRLLPGNHLIQVRSSGSVIFEQKVYLADGARRQVLVGNEK